MPTRLLVEALGVRYIAPVLLAVGVFVSVALSLEPGETITLRFVPLFITLYSLFQGLLCVLSAFFLFIKHKAQLVEHLDSVKPLMTKGWFITGIVFAASCITDWSTFNTVHAALAFFCAVLTFAASECYMEVHRIFLAALYSKEKNND